MAVLQLVAAVLVIACATGVPAGLVQMAAWVHMAENAGGLGQLKRVMVEDPACELCELSRRLASDSPEERRDGRERGPVKPDFSILSGTVPAGHRQDERMREANPAWARPADQRHPHGHDTRPPTPPPRASSLAQLA